MEAVAERSRCPECGEELILVNGFDEEKGHFMALVCPEHGVLSKITKSSDD